MVSKADYQYALVQLGFIKENNSRTDGSHIRYHHSQYKNIVTGIDDHKNTKEMNSNIHKELIKAMSLILWLECKDENNIIDFEKVKKITSKLNDELKNAIIKNLKKLNENKPNLLMQIVPKKLLTEISKAKNEVSDKTIIEFIIK